MAERDAAKAAGRGGRKAAGRGDGPMVQDGSRRAITYNGFVEKRLCADATEGSCPGARDVRNEDRHVCFLVAAPLIRQPRSRVPSGRCRASRCLTRVPAGPLR